MPISKRIAIASQSFNHNARFLKGTIDGLTDDEWLRRPCDRSNHMLWIVGHMAWSRTPWCLHGWETNGRNRG